jgi:hypothetical protein
LLPASALGSLEQAVLGLDLTHDSLLARIQEAYRKLAIQSPGVTPEHFAQAILLAASEG